MNQGWSCPHCGKAHGPDVVTCPNPPSESLGEGMRKANAPKVGHWTQKRLHPTMPTLGQMLFERRPEEQVLYN